MTGLCGKEGYMESKKYVGKCYLYTRVSTAMQVEGYSLDAQLNRLYKEAEYRDLEVVEVFSDEGKWNGGRAPLWL